MRRNHRQLRQRNRQRHRHQRRCWSRNHRLKRRNQPIERRNRQQSSSTRNLRQKRSCLSRSQSQRQRRIRQKTRKRRSSYRSLRIDHRKIVNHWCQHQRRFLSFSWIKQNRWIQPHHGLSSSCRHLLLRFLRQRCCQIRRFESLHRSLHWRRQKKRRRRWSRIQRLRIRNQKNQIRCPISQSWRWNQISPNLSRLSHLRKKIRISRTRLIKIQRIKSCQRSWMWRMESPMGRRQRRKIRRNLYR